MVGKRKHPLLNSNFHYLEYCWELMLTFSNPLNSRGFELMNLPHGLIHTQNLKIMHQSKIQKENSTSNGL
jgi:hypothetical protein